jgi:hypothetical protein
MRPARLFTRSYELCAAYKAGQPLDEIVEEFDMSLTSAKKILGKNGVKLRDEDMLADSNEARAARLTIRTEELAFRPRVQSFPCGRCGARPGACDHQDRSFTRRISL